MPEPEVMRRGDDGHERNTAQDEVSPFLSV